MAFVESGLREIHIPDGVEEICDGCLAGCRNLSCITFGEASNLQRIGQKVFDDSGLTKVCASKSKQKLIQKALEKELVEKVTFSDPQQAPKTNPNQ